MADIKKVERVVSFRIITDACDLEDHSVSGIVIQADKNVIDCFVESEANAYGRIFTILIDLPTSLPPAKRLQSLVRIGSELKKYNLVGAEFMKQLRSL